MESRAGNARKRSLGGLYVGTFCLVWSYTATAQGLSDNISAISGSASAFTNVTHIRTDRGDSEYTNTEPGVGLSGRVGGTLESGANTLDLRYGGTLQTKHETIDDEQSGNTSIIGASRYRYFDPGSRLDFNLGHTINSVRNNTGFELDPTSYDTQNTLTAGAGLSFYPGDLSTWRFSGQAGRSFGSDELDDERSITLASDFSRRLTERSTGGLNVRRSWSDEDDLEITIDTAQLVYSLALESGSFRVGGGGSRAETEYSAGATSEYEAFTGFIERAWMTSYSRTSVKFDRSMSDSATELTLNQPPIFSFQEPDSVRLRDLVIEDSLTLTHDNQQMCSACDVGVYASLAKLESQNSGDTTYEYRGGASLGFQLTTLQRLNFGYRWEGDADDNTGNIVDQVHRLNMSWTREIAENTTFGVEFYQSYLRSESLRNDGDQFELRFVVSRGFSLVEARQ
ncbi:MAG: hypothetical protein ACTHYN_10095 [Marinobacter sp.]|uniref:hypothetical protein n=1 Tax=Marinobacter sp. TaxID=50741 RepID=UPI003F9DA346